jgi:hypothetical protein
VDEAGAGTHRNDEQADGKPILVANEFAEVEVRPLRTRNGIRLEIYSPRRGTRVALDAVELDVLSYQEPEFFSELLERMPGPGG